MITAYHRPDNLTDALALLSRETPTTMPLGGGTTLSRQRKPDFEVVDLQRLGLNTIEREGQMLTLGATVTLQQLYDSPELPDGILSALQESLRHEVGQNLRQMATLGGIIAGCDGRSPFVTALLALEPRLIWAPGDEQVQLGDYLPLRGEFKRGRLILCLKFPLNAHLSFAQVARTPMDRPIVCAAVATWPSGRTRVALGGFGPAPILAMDGPEAGGAAMAAREAFRHTDDEWASGEFRADIAAKLTARLIAEQA